MTDKTFCSLSFFKVDLHMHTVSQNRDKFTTNNLFYCCKALIFTHPLVYEFLCGPKHMATPVKPYKWLISGLTKTPPFDGDSKRLSLYFSMRINCQFCGMLGRQHLEVTGSYI